MKFPFLLTIVLIITLIAAKCFAQEEFLDRPKEEATRFFSSNNITSSIKPFRDSVYPAIKEKLTVKKFKRWNMEGALELEISKDGIIKSFEIHFIPKGWKTKSYEQNLLFAIDELTKKYGEAFFSHLEKDISSYAWDTKNGEYNFLIFTKKHTWTFGFYPDTGD